MNRTFVWGIAIVIAVLGIALLGTQVQAVAQDDDVAVADKADTCAPKTCAPKRCCLRERLCRARTCRPKECKPADTCEPKTCRPRRCRPKTCAPKTCAPKVCEPADTCAPKTCRPRRCRRRRARRRPASRPTPVSRSVAVRDAAVRGPASRRPAPRLTTEKWKRRPPTRHPPPPLPRPPRPRRLRLPPPLKSIPGWTGVPQGYTQPVEWAPWTTPLNGPEPALLVPDQPPEEAQPDLYSGPASLMRDTQKQTQLALEPPCPLWYKMNLQADRFRLRLRHEMPDTLDGTGPWMVGRPKWSLRRLRKLPPCGN